HDHQVSLDDGAGEPTAVAADSPELLGQRPLPEDLAVLVEGQEQARGAVAVDVAGGGVAGEVRPADPAADDVGVEDVELVLPEQFARLDVEADDALLLLVALADVAVEEDS